jgi:hypothetical protein
VGGPDEAFGDDRIALVVDLETSAVHEPRPGAFDDPTLGERFEATGVDAIHHFDADVMISAMLDESALEPRVAPQLGEASGTLAGTVGHGDATGVVRERRGHDDHRHQESERVDDPEGLAAVDPLSGVISLCFLAHRGELRHGGRAPCTLERDERSLGHHQECPASPMGRQSAQPIGPGCRQEPAHDPPETTLWSDSALKVAARLTRRDSDPARSTVATQYFSKLTRFLRVGTAVFLTRKAGKNGSKTSVDSRILFLPPVGLALTFGVTESLH